MAKLMTTSKSTAKQAAGKPPAKKRAPPEIATKRPAKKAPILEVVAKQPPKKRAALEKNTAIVAPAVARELAPELAPETKARRKNVASSGADEPVSAAVAAPRRRRSYKRSELTIDTIFAATEKVVLESGAERISILEVCEIAGVSRGTFYRYFASQDELLEAFTRHKRDNFHKVLAEKLLFCTDPDERFSMLINYLEDYLYSGVPQRMLLVAPDFAMRFFKRIFHDAVVRFQDMLFPVFSAWEQSLDVKLDRELICDLLIRYVLSEILVVGESERGSMLRRVARLIDTLRFGGIARARR